MTLNELILELLDMQATGGGDLPVRFAYPSGDHWHTILAEEVTSVNAGATQYSAYHSKESVVDNSDAPEDYDPEQDDESNTKPNCVLLS
jgi:hypothetical protein